MGERVVWNGRLGRNVIPSHPPTPVAKHMPDPTSSLEALMIGSWAERTKEDLFIDCSSSPRSSFSLQVVPPPAPCAKACMETLDVVATF